MASWGPGLGLPCHYFGHIHWHHTIGVYFVLTSSPLVVGLTKNVIFNMWPPRLHAQHMREDRGTRPGLEVTQPALPVVHWLNHSCELQREEELVWQTAASLSHTLSSLHGFLFLSLHFNFFYVQTYIPPLGLKWAEWISSGFDAIIIVIISANNREEVADRNRLELLCSVLTQSTFCQAISP